MRCSCFIARWRRGGRPRRGSRRAAHARAICMIPTTLDRPAAGIWHIYRTIKPGGPRPRGVMRACRLMPLSKNLRGPIKAVDLSLLLSTSRELSRNITSILLFHVHTARVCIVYGESVTAHTVAAQAGESPLSGRTAPRFAVSPGHPPEVIAAACSTTLLSHRQQLPWPHPKAIPTFAHQCRLLALPLFFR